MFFPQVLLNTDANLLDNRLSFFARVFGVDTNPEVGMWLLFIAIYLLAVLSYVLGFAKKIKLWQNIVIYILMFIGCLPLTLFGAFYPVAECMVVIAAVMGIYRFRLHQDKKSGKIKVKSE